MFRLRPEIRLSSGYLRTVRRCADAPFPREQGVSGILHFSKVLMNNHFHLLVQCENPRELSPWMAGLLRAYVHYFNRRYAFVGHLWQGRFRSPAVEVESYFLSCARYIERNPLMAGLVAEPWGKDGPVAAPTLSAWRIRCSAGNVWYRDLGRDAASRQQRWRAFLLGDDSNEEAVQRRDWIVGSEGYRRRMEHCEARPARRRGRPRKPPPGQEGYFSESYEMTRDA